MHSRNRRFALRMLSAFGGLILGSTVFAIATRPADPSAAYFPTAKVVVNPDIPNGVDLGTTGKPKKVLHVPRGPIYRPNSHLTPGAVADTNVRTVCAINKKDHTLFAPGVLNTAVSPELQQATFNAYKIPTQRTKLYGLDYLVPLQLGGAQVASNVWPVPRTGHGLGFREKEILNIRVHVLVCHGEMTLAMAQKQMETDWATLWFTYGVDLNQA